MSTLIKNNEVILFQGDSVTDAGRTGGINNGMGIGYPSIISAWFSALYPEKHVRFINRGISGDRVANLQKRWKEDCLDLKPDWVSILIGINDCWRRYDSNDPTSVEKYEAGYRNILTEITEKLRARIIILEPFVLPVTAEQKSWREDLDPKIHTARSLAKEFGALYLPLDGLFAQASAIREPEYWSEDGVHPSQAGHALIARAWLNAVKAL